MKTTSPAGAVTIPDSGRDDVGDTIASVRAYLPGATVVVIDDRAGPEPPRRLGPGCVVLPPLPYPRNAFGGLWAKQCYGLRFVLANLRVDYVLRLDSDAVVLGEGLDNVVVERFRADPTCGVLGAYRLGRDGGIRDFGPAQRAIGRESGWAGLRRPASRRALRALLRAAEHNGYVPGEHALGAVVAFRPVMLRRWLESGWLDLDGLARSPLADDWLLSLAARASGYSLGDLAGPGGPVAVEWKGLPASPEALLAEGVLATHSVRSWGGRSEREIRQFFAERRPAPVREERDPPMGP
jgi:hypothetical protein